MNIAYVNGRYVPLKNAEVHVEDRGYQFADGIYEYMAFFNRRLLDCDLHLKRLERSLKELGIALPMSLEAMNIVIEELIAQNSRDDGGVYMQVTRGVAKRDHPFPKGVKPAFVMTVCGPKYPKPFEVKDGVKVMTTRDTRWDRRDIKSVSLLANVLLKQEASKHSMREAWLVMDDGRISEGSVSNAFIINKNGAIVTHPADKHILGGITRDVVLRLARKAGIEVIEKPFSMSDMKAASEAFLTSSSANVLPVTQIDDMVIGNGKPRATTMKLMQLYHDHVYKQTGKRFNVPE
jgi:D-alanine transaminase